LNCGTFRVEVFLAPLVLRLLFEGTPARVAPDTGSRPIETGLPQVEHSL